MEYGYSKHLHEPFDMVVDRTKTALQTEGFGVLTEIDVQETLKRKLGIESDAYVILGACNPPYAHQALTIETEIGLLLPCNVIVYEHDGETIVSAIDPVVAMSIVDNNELEPIAHEIRTRLRRAIDSISA